MPIACCHSDIRKEGAHAAMRARRAAVALTEQRMQRACPSNVAAGRNAQVKTCSLLSGVRWGGMGGRGREQGSDARPLPSAAELA